MRKWFRKFFSSGSFIPFVLLLPYVVTILFNGADKALVWGRWDAEKMVPLLLMVQLKGDYEPELVKAQAVIARSDLYRKAEKNEKVSLEGRKGAWGIERIINLAGNMELYQRAAEDTAGQVLTYEGELRLLPYHEVSCGITRDGEEVFQSPEYGYLKSVDSSQDKESPDYINSTYVEASRLPAQLVIQKRDSAGYVTALTADGYWMEGEAFRRGMHLASGNFSVQKIGKAVRFLCKGKGHGIGLSQYGGNEMAKNGSNWEEILLTYFPEMKIEEIGEVEISLEK